MAGNHAVGIVMEDAAAGQGVMPRNRAVGAMMVQVVSKRLAVAGQPCVVVVVDGSMQSLVCTGVAEGGAVVYSGAVKTKGR